MMRYGAPANLKLSPHFFGGPEWSLLTALRWGRIPVARFSSTGAVLCLNSRRARYGRCTRPRNEEFSYKYSAEFSETSGNVARLELGWSWYWTPPPIFDPPCFENVEDQESCCHRMHGVAGNPDCWTDVFDYHRCCEPSRGLFILPSPAKASELLEAGTVPLCWPMVAAVKRCVLREHLEEVVGPAGQVLILDKVCSRVTQASLAGGAVGGGLVVAGGTSGSFSNSLLDPEALDYDDAAGHIYIADTSNHRVMRWDVGGATGTAFVTGGPSTAVGKLQKPTGVALTA
eukprot:symbB.v1.2.025900.t1/scaffold2457.1/size150448/1